jgi:hypothetical protein
VVEAIIAEAKMQIGTDAGAAQRSPDLNVRNPQSPS